MISQSEQFVFVSPSSVLRRVLRGLHLCRRVRQTWTPTAVPEDNLNCHERNIGLSVSLRVLPSSCVKLRLGRNACQGAPRLMQSLLIYVAYVLRLHRSSQTYGLLRGRLCYDKLHAGKNLFPKYLWCVQEPTKDERRKTQR